MIRGRFGRADNVDMKRAFGLDDKAKWPAEGMAQRDVQGYQVYVKALPPKPRKFMLRVMAICPQCDQHVSFSRMHQHEKIHANG